MEYFTRAWAIGDLADDEWGKVLQAYQAYIDTLDHNSAVWRFATTVGLNDAIFDRMDIGSGNVRLQLLTGDRQHGYFHTVITYRNVNVTIGQDALAQAMENNTTEIWYAEFSGCTSEMVHRFLLVETGGTEDRGEVHIKFTSLEYCETPAQGGELPDL